MLATRFATIAVLLFFAVIIIIACKKNKDNTPTDSEIIAEYLNLPANPFNYTPVLPAHFNGPAVQSQNNTPAGNPLTDWGATLGRVLFYDKNLSQNKTISCASCHQQAHGFSDPAAKSAGFNGGFTGRNSMSIINAMFYPNGRFFWDQRAATLEEQSLLPIQDLIEMGMTLPELEARLKTLPYYPVLFTKAFGVNIINSNRISQALSQFVRSVVSYQSKYDAGRAAFPAAPPPPANAVFPNFSATENRGKELFLNGVGCNTCHGTETFTAPGEKNNGLDLVNNDKGFGAVTGNPAMDGHFKVTTLRNVELTAPYMHDGRFNTLEQVIEHYNSGVKDNPNLSPQLRMPNGQPRQLNLSPADKAALVAFLKTLTDASIATDIRFSDPFK